MANNGKLTPKQEAFVREYLISLNATDAARRAGYSAKNADKIGPQLLGNTRVSEAIAAAQKARSERTLVTADRVVRELARVAFSDARKLYRPDGTLKAPSEWDDETAAAVSGVETDESVMQIAETERLTTRTHKVKRWDKVKALDMLARHTGVYPEKGARAGDDEPEFQQEE